MASTFIGYIAVGSNIAPEDNILRAVEELARHARLTAISTFYRTPPIGRPDQSEFLNGVVRVESDQTARALKFDVLRKIEENLGREREGDKFAARTIDLDLALWGNEIIDEPDLRIPDPNIRQRPFIAIPLHELDPDLVLPDTRDKLAALIARMDRTDLQLAAEFTERLKILVKAAEK